MAFSSHHQVPLLCVTSLEHLSCAHRIRYSVASHFWIVRIGMATGSLLNFKLRFLSAGNGWLNFLITYLLQLFIETNRMLHDHH
jgi:hypothetical protein